MPYTGNGTGKTGKSFNDRVLAGEVRRLTLKQIKAILEREEMDELKKAVLLKLTTNILPRLNELSGQNGEPIAVKGMIHFVNAPDSES